MAALPAGLLEAVRNYLDITWVDAGGDLKLTGIISRGMKYIDGVAGKACNYTEEDKPRELLLDYCRYARSNALHEFQQNYLPELLTLQHTVEIKQALEAAGLTALTIGALVLTPAFSPSAWEYEATAAGDSDIISVTLARWDAVLSITVNGTAVENDGLASWESGGNVVLVKGQYSGVTVTYVVIVTR